MDNTNGLQEVRVEIKSPITINRNKSPDLTYSVAYCRPFAVSIGLIELVVSSLFAGFLCYLGQNYKDIKPILQFPHCLTDKMAVGVLNSLSILCGFEFVLAIWLLNSILKTKIDQMRCWLIIMMTYEIVMLTFVICLGLSGCRADPLNTLTFFRALFRFLEFAIVFAHVEEETLKRMRHKLRAVRETLCDSTATSRSNISISEPQEEHGEI